MSVAAILNSVAEEGVPAEAELVMSALEAGRNGAIDRRAERRYRHRVVGSLRLFSDQPDAPAWVIYTRDVSARGLGFITPHRLPLGHGGIVELCGFDGRPFRIHCTLLRCREAARDWFEGNVYFNRDQPQFIGPA